MTQVRVFESRDAFAGVLPDGSRVFITIHGEMHTGEHETVDHDVIVDPLDLGFSAGIILPASHVRDFDGGCGQILEDLTGMEPAKGSAWTADDIASLLQLWKDWHLNTMTPGCIHVPDPVWEDVPYRRPDLVNTPRCPATGYRWGHSWLTKPLPEGVFDEARRLSEIDPGKRPKWLNDLS